MQHEPSAEAIAKALHGRRTGTGWQCKCPAHDDRNASLALRVKDGHLLWFCHTGCSQEDVRSGLERLDLWPSKANGRANGHSHSNNGRQQPRTERPAKVVETYPYPDESGRLVFEVVRLEPKGFRQRRPDGTWSVQGVRQVSYRLPELIEAIAKEQPVFVTEGEKDADNLAKLNITATCNAGGAGKWKSEHAAFLQDADVVIIPDNDTPGRDHAEAVARSLQGIARRVRVLELPDLPEKEDVSWWLEKGGGTAEQLWRLVDQAPDWQAKTRQSQIIWGIPAGEETQRWLIQGILPESGVGLASGQWGTGKTFVAMELAAAVLTGGTFAGHQIARPGGVFWMAAEGQSQVPVRLRALKTKHDLDVNQFAWTKICPLLTDATAREELLALCHEVKEGYGRFNLPLSLVVIDTITATAGWKDENDAAGAQAVMSMLTSVAQEVGTCIIGIDHFGKTPDTGTRGASSKEAASDFVLAVLGDRELSGSVKNSRIAVRKTRGGEAGMEFPFATTKVQLDNDETSCIISWQEGAGQQARTKWPKSLKVFKTALDNTLATSGQPLRPSSDSSIVIAVDIEQVRPEFYQLYAATSETEEQKQEARRKAFERAVKAAQEAELIGAANLKGVTFVWLIQERI